MDSNCQIRRGKLLRTATGLAIQCGTGATAELLTVALRAVTGGGQPLSLKPGLNVVCLCDASNQAQVVMVDVGKPDEELRPYLERWRPHAEYVRPSAELDQAQKTLQDSPVRIEGSKPREEPDEEEQIEGSTVAKAVDLVHGVVKEVMRGHGGGVNWVTVQAEDGHEYKVEGLSRKRFPEIKPNLRLIFKRLSPNAYTERDSGVAVGIDHEAQPPSDRALIRTIRGITSVEDLILLQESIPNWNTGYLHAFVINEFVSQYKIIYKNLSELNYQICIDAVVDLLKKCRNRGEKTGTLPLARSVAARYLIYGYFHTEKREYLERIVDECRSRYKDPIVIKIGQECLENPDYERIVRSLCSPRTGLGFSIESFSHDRFRGRLNFADRSGQLDEEQSRFLRDLEQANGKQLLPFIILTRDGIAGNLSLMTNRGDVPSMHLILVAPYTSDQRQADIARIRRSLRARSEHAVLIDDFSEEGFSTSWHRVLLDHLKITQGIEVTDPVVGQAFFGRREMIQQILDTPSQHAFFLTGLRKVGKTSLARQLLQEMSIERGYELRLGPWDSSQSTHDQAMRFEVIKGLPKDTTSTLEKKTEPYFQTREIIAAAENTLDNSALFIDELSVFFDHRMNVAEGQGSLVLADRNSRSFVGHLFDWLRSLIDTKKILLFAASPTAKVVNEPYIHIDEHTRFENPLYGLFKVVHVTGIAAKETEEMVHWFTSRHLVTCEPGVPLAIHHLSGGIPAISRALLYFLIDGKQRPQVVRLTDVEQFPWSQVEKTELWKRIRNNLRQTLGDISGGEQILHGIVDYCRKNDSMPFEKLREKFSKISLLEQIVDFLQAYGYITVKGNRLMPLNGRLLARILI